MIFEHYIDWVILNQKDNWEIYLYQLKSIYCHLHVCFKSLMHSPLQKFSLFQVPQAERSCTEKKAKKVAHLKIRAKIENKKLREESLA